MRLSLVTLTALAGLAAPSLHAQAEAQPSSVYEKLLAETDKGADFLMLMDTQGDAEAFGNYVGKYLAEYSQAFPEQGIPPINVTQILSALGFTDVEGFSVSSVDAGDFHRNVIYIHAPALAENYRTDYGYKNRPLNLGDLVPADSMMAIDIDMDIRPLRKAVIAIAETVMGPMGRSIVEAQLQNPVPFPGSPVTIDEVLTIFNGRIYGFATMRPVGETGTTADFFIQLPRGADLTIKFLTEAGGIEYSEVEGLTVAPLPPIPLPEPAEPLQAVVVADPASNTLMIASSLDLALKIRKGDFAKLSDNPDYKTVSAGLPTEGYTATYISPSYYTFYLNQLRNSMNKGLEQAEGPQAAVAGIVMKLFNDYFSRMDNGQYSVGHITADGFRSVGHSDQSMKEAAIVTAAAVPVTIGAVAAMAIPAYQKVQENSQEKAILNNLRQLSSAADQYFLETGETQVMSDALIGPDAYITGMKSVAGESYYGILIPFDYTELQVTRADGRIVYFGKGGGGGTLPAEYGNWDDSGWDDASDPFARPEDPALVPEWEAQMIDFNLMLLSSAAEQYFLETGETEVHSSVLIGPDGYLTEGLESIAGESYEMTIKSDFSDLSVTTSDGRTMTYWK